MSVKSTHSIDFYVDITQHGVPDGADEVVTQGFWGFDGGYQNVPREMVLEVQALGAEFIAKLVELGKEYNAAKKAPKSP